MIEKEKYIVQPNVKNVRLSDYLVGKMKLLPSRKSVKKAIKAGLILVNGEVGTTGQFVETFDTLTLIEKDETLKKVFEWRLEVVYEDEYLAIINKPAGLSVSGNHFRTIENALPFNLKMSTRTDALQRFRAVHRLDALTSGLLLVAKTKTARIQLGQLFEQKKNRKNLSSHCHRSVTRKWNYRQTY